MKSIVEVIGGVEDLKLFVRLQIYTTEGEAVFRHTWERRYNSDNAVLWEAIGFACMSKSVTEDACKAVVYTFDDPTKPPFEVMAVVLPATMDELRRLTIPPVSWRDEADPLADLNLMLKNMLHNREGSNDND